MMIVDLKKHQRYVKENFENNTLQVVLYQNLLKILDVRRKTINQTGADEEIGYQDDQAAGFDRLIVRE